MTPGFATPQLTKRSIGGLDEIAREIALRASYKLNTGEPGCSTYPDAVRAVAKEQPALFLTRARLELDATYRNSTIYFDFINGQLVNPTVMKDGRMYPISEVLNTAPLNPSITADQEMALRIADKMKLLASQGKQISYAKALLLVASESPRLVHQKLVGACRKAW